MVITGADTPVKSDNIHPSSVPLSVNSSSQSKFDAVTVMNKMSLKEHLQMYWKFFFEKAEKTPEGSLPQQQPELSDLFDRRENDLKASWLGHSSLLINMDGYSILTDPVFKRKISSIGPARFNKELPLNISDLPRVDVVIISHDHYDHLNKLSVQQLSDKAGVFVVPLGLENV